MNMKFGGGKKTEAKQVTNIGESTSEEKKKMGGGERTETQVTLETKRKGQDCRAIHDPPYRNDNKFAPNHL